MNMNIILAGVGGQGILTTARAISIAALRHGWQVKQAELHGMSQRGGAVQSHLRIADHDIQSDLIPLKSADLILAVEPLEALRYVQYLADDGVIVANTTPVMNIADYGDLETILKRIAQHRRHTLLDANRLAAAAGSSRAVNMVMFGAAADCLDLPIADCQAAIAEMLGAKGEKAVHNSQRAFDLGRQEAALYQEGLNRGLEAHVIRERLGRLSAAEIETSVDRGIGWGEGGSDELLLSPAQFQLVEETLSQAVAEGRGQLLEPEVYAIVAAAGAIQPPKHQLISNPAAITAGLLAEFPGHRIVLKVVSPQVIHKSDMGAVEIVPRELDQVRERAARMLEQALAHAERVDGILLVEYVEHATAGFGGELFVGIRATREFGPVIAAGLGGVDTEYLAARLRPGVAVAKALALEVTADSFFVQFRETVAWEILSGHARRHPRAVSDGELRRCFRAFIALARRFCVARHDGGPELVELEVNPFAFRRHALVPLDGRGRIDRVARPARPRSPEQIDRLLVPRSIAVVGASARRQNFGRIILDNVKRCGFPPDALFAIKRDEAEIDGVPCVSELAELPAPVDLLVLATGSADVPAMVDEVLLTRRAGATIIISGGLGERAGTEAAHEALRRRIEQARCVSADGPVFLGENCLGIRSRPGRYDTFFIEDKKLNPRRDRPPRRVALVSQSGAFAIARLSNVPELDPVLAVSLGNQLDLTIADLVDAVGRREEVDVIGVYAEGFRDLDGLALVRVVERLAAAGKDVVFYKAGRTEPGRSATAGHTASIAGDYDVCLCALEQAGALVTETVKEFEQVLQIAAFFHDYPVGGRRIAALSNAGFEAVAMADAVVGPRHRVELARWSPRTEARFRGVLAEHRLDGIVNIVNPLDLTPMASDAVFEACIRAMLEEPAADAVVASLIPLTPQMRTTADEIADEQSLCKRLPQLVRHFRKPLVVVLDAGRPYAAFAEAIRAAGIPVFPSCDQAVRSLGRYLCHRTRRATADPARSHSARGVTERSTRTPQMTLATAPDGQ